MAKTIVGGKEWVTIIGPAREKTVLARVDTGATKNSIDKQLAKQLGLGPVLRYKTVKSAHGTLKRGLIMARLRIAGRTFKVYFTLADRKHMKHSVLIGRNILKRGFLVDVAKPAKHR
jgi:hypothetical protein